MYSNACCKSSTVTFFHSTNQKLFPGFVLAVDVVLCWVSVLSKTGHSALWSKLLSSWGTSNEYCQQYEFLILICHLLRLTKTFPTSNIWPSRNYVISFVFATEVEKLLRNINIYKSPGPDCISPRILRECSQVLSSPLAWFLNTSFSQVQLPCIWKHSRLTMM